MARTVFVEPWESGHRLQWVAWIADQAHARGDDLILLTSPMARQSEQLEAFCGHLPFEVREVFADQTPTPKQVGAAIAAVHREEPIDAFVISDADQLVKRWWRDAPRSIRRGRHHPKGYLVMVRYPPRWPWTDPPQLGNRLAKTALCLAALARGAAHRVLFLVGRDDTREGGALKRVRDPALCTFHSRDRAGLRERFDLPADRRLVGVLGSVSMRKNVDIVLEACRAAGPDVDLLVAGGLWDDVREWLAGLSPEEAARVHVRDRFLSDEELDAYVAASEVVAVAHSNPGPSGIMGKALAAGVPVLSSGSRVRRKEATSLAFGVHTELAPGPMADGIRALLADEGGPQVDHLRLPTAADFGRVVLGLQANGDTSPVPAHG